MMLLIKSSLIIALFLVFYKLLLGKETYFKANRYFLLVGLLAAFLIPQLSLPEMVSDQGFVEREINRVVLPTSGGNISNDLTLQENTGHEVLTKENKVNEAQSSPGWSSWIFTFYLFGVIILGVNLIIQIAVVVGRILRSNDSLSDGFITIINSNQKIEPCSFFNYIFVNPSLYDHDTYRQIIDHEKIHVKRLHTADLLISEITVIVLWFNPLIWFYRKEIEKNIEFETDAIMLTDGQHARDTYQRSLLQVAVYAKPLLVTTNYNQSLLKQRILKMNAKKSHGFNYWKYIFALPVIFGCLLFLNPPSDAYGQVEGAQVYIDEVSDCAKLLRAVRKNDATSVTALLKDVNPNCSYYEDGEPRSALVAAARNGNIDIGRDLIESGADPEYHARGDETPLMAAARNRHIQFVNLLIEHGAEIDRVVKGDGTALINAVSAGDLEIAKVLLDRGADPYLEAPGDEYAMYHARISRNQPMIDLLLTYTRQE